MNNIFCRLIFIVVFFKCNSLYSQTTIVTYNYEYHNFSSFTINKRNVDWIDKGVFTLIFNDSISFQSPKKNNNVYKSFENLLKPPLGHFTHYIKYDNSNMYKVKFIGRKDSLEFITDTITKPTWVTNDTIKYFLNYRCKEAYTVTTLSDTIFILYAVDIPLPFGPYDYFGAPGLVVEAFNTKSNFYVIAKYIEQSMYQMILPNRK